MSAFSFYPKRSSVTDFSRFYAYAIIGHPRSGDRCAETRLDRLDPSRVAEQISPLSTPLQGVLSSPLYTMR